MDGGANFVLPDNEALFFLFALFIPTTADFLDPVLSPTCRNFTTNLIRNFTTATVKLFPIMWQSLEGSRHLLARLFFAVG